MDETPIILSTVPLDELVGRLAKAVGAELFEKSSVDRQSNEGLLTRVEAARLLHVTLPTLRLHTRTGKLKGYRLGARVLYKRSEILAGLGSMK